MTDTREMLEGAVQLLPSGLLLDRSRAYRRYFSLKRSDIAVLGEGFPDAFGSALDRFTETRPRYDSLPLLAEHLSDELMHGLAVMRDGAERGGLHVLGFARRFVAFIRGEEVEPEPSPRVGDTHWHALVCAPPRLRLGALDECLATVAAEHPAEPQLLLDRAGCVFDRAGSIVDHRLPLRRWVTHDLHGSDMRVLWERLDQVCAELCGAHDESETDHAFLARLLAEGELRGTRPGFEDLVVRSDDGHALYFGVRIPEHLAETPTRLWAHWPETELGVDVRRDEQLRPGQLLHRLTFAVEQYAAYGVHPLTGSESVCLDDSALLTVQHLAARRASRAEQIARGLLTAQHTVLYGVVQGARVHAPYPEARVAEDPVTAARVCRVPLLSRERARALAQARRVELVPWR